MIILRSIWDTLKLVVEPGVASVLFLLLIGHLTFSAVGHGKILRVYQSGARELRLSSLGVETFHRCYIRMGFRANVFLLCIEAFKRCPKAEWLVFFRSFTDSFKFWDIVTRTSFCFQKVDMINAHVFAETWIEHHYNLWQSQFSISMMPREKTISLVMIVHNAT